MALFGPTGTVATASLALSLALPLAGAAPSPPRPPIGWTPCGELRDAQALWNCWAGTDGSHPGIEAAACVPGGACPPTDQGGHLVLNCYYEKSWRTGFNCILFCNYGGAFPWGSDGGPNCD
jgi:hypothetical protein